MERPIKIIIGSAIAGLLIYGCGFAGSKYFESELTGLVQSCEAESERSRANAKHEWEKNKLVCEPSELVNLGDSEGIQLRIVETHQKVQTWLEFSKFLAILVFVTGALPFAWYFLLRRIRELSDAIQGK